MDTRRGLMLAVGAYLLWGVLPVYLLLARPASPFEIVAWRVVFSLLFCLIAVTVLRRFGRLRAVFADRRLLITIGGAGVLVFINWSVYVYATTSGEVVDAALGYFINPVLTVLLGVVVLRERLRPLQWASVAISVVAVVVLTVFHGGFPWIALALAGSFGLYGLAKHRVGRRVDPLTGLTIETIWLLPIAIVELVLVGAFAGISFGSHGVGQAAALAGTGIATAVPLLLFAGASRRLPLTLMGLIQYATPIIQLVVGVVILREPMSAYRWVGFGIVWVALVVFSIDLVRAGRRAEAGHEPAGATAVALD